MSNKLISRLFFAFASLFCISLAVAQAPSTRYTELAGIPYDQGFIQNQGARTLADEIFFQRAVQAYIWAIPALNMYAMKEGSEKVFGKGYNVLPIFKDRLNAKTLITTPNSDVIYALGYLDLKQDGPLVIEVPPGMQGILDDFYQRPICSEVNINGRQWCGDVGLPGPDQGKGANYLILPPDYKGPIPEGYLIFRSRTYGVFVFWRGFFKDPKQLKEPVSLMERTRIYPLGKKEASRPMEFPNASNVAVNMLYPQDGSAFDLLDRFIQAEYIDSTDMTMRGNLAGIGIIKGQPFKPDAHARQLLDDAAKTASRYSHTLAYMGAPVYYPDRNWLNPFPASNASFLTDSYQDLNMRAAFFTYAYSASPGMAVNMSGVGAKYPNAFKDADGKFLSGTNNYKLHLPAHIPARLFWSVSVYDAITGSGLDNGQPFPSINTMDRPQTNADGSTDIYIGADNPGKGKNWLRTIPGKGFFVILRLYGPTQPFFDKTWVPDDIIHIK